LWCSCWKTDALHAAALTTRADKRHERIDKLENELEADLLLVEHEAKWLKGKILR
jgi:hypothetical protein